MPYRVGFGYDVHKLTSGRKLILGGVHIPNPVGCLAHSDGDVVVHAICDALLGAANLRDIGYHFPDNAGEFKDINSLVLLERITGLLQDHGYVPGNVDTTICLQRPKLKDYIPQMQEKIAQAIQIETGRVSVKATTTEGLGFVGKEEGVAAYAVALIVRKENT
ncbi:MAG: 2-C-methyl-D-erythritol 2,4-cyclodiphosphate synthase [Bacteroidales bacterium]|nr:2-C-methyl-D-erythritol 2,4-cyclodiphosphate synthase [Bacteroidales bacterium]MBN2761616.1 2-C-methyl-D-erythritol 2,4-cyclodiphosphate synthase [Bacteroidales bacterium]